MSGKQGKWAVGCPAASLWWGADVQPHFGLERLVTKPGFCILKTSLAQDCRWLLGEKDDILVWLMCSCCQSWFHFALADCLVPKWGVSCIMWIFDLMNGPFSRLACVLPNKDYIFSHIKGLGLYIMSMW